MPQLYQTDDVQLTCPECGGTHFSWVSEVIEYGSVVRTERGNIQPRTEDQGDVIENRMHEHGADCTSCGRRTSPENLVPIESNDTTHLE